MFTITDIRKQRARNEKRRARLRSWLLWGGGTLVVLTLLVVFVLPPVLRSQLERRLSKHLDRKVVVEAARFNPLRASAVITGLHVQDKDGEELLGWGRLYVNFKLTALLFGDVEFDEISLSGFAGRVLVQQDGTLSVADLLGQSSRSPSAEGTPKRLALKISKLRLEGSKFSFEDRSRGENFVTHLGPLNISLNDFEVHPEKRAPYEFTAVTEAGGRLAWKGQVGVSPLRSSGEFSLNGIVLRKYAPYYRSHVNFDVLDGRLSLEGQYDFVMSAEGPRLKFTSGKLGLAGLALAKAGTKDPVLALGSLAATGLELDSGVSKALISDVSIKGLQVSAVRGRDGSLDLEHLVMPRNPPPPAGPSAEPVQNVSNQWIQQFRLARFRLEDAQFDLRDEAARRAVVFSVRELGLALDDVSLVKGAEISMDLSAKLGGNAPVKAKGQLSFSPVKADLQWSLEDLPLAGFSPYLEEQVRARLVQGRLSSQGKLLLLSEGGVPSLTCSAKLDLKQVAFVDEANGEPLAGWDAFSLSGIDFDQRSGSLLINEVLLRGPSVSASIGKDGVVNLAGLLRERSAPKITSIHVAEPSAPVLALSLGKVSIEGGKAFLSDQSVRPEVRFSVRDFGGQINGLDTRANHPAKLAISGNLEGSGKVLIEGVLHPFGKQAATDLKLAVDGLNLVAFSPYSGKYAGYGLSSGRFNLDVKLKLEDRKLESANVMTLDHFSFGEPVNSPDATKLPVRLAVALLKDRQGRILVDIPVNGSLDDPEFKVGRVVWRVVGNLLTKAASSPFTLLGAAFGGGEELAQIEFAAGSTSFTSDAQKKLSTLQKALVDRPGLALALTGNYDSTGDVAALRTQHLEQLVARAVWQARVSANPNAATVAELPVSAAEREQTLRALYAVNHPGTAAGMAASAMFRTAEAKTPVGNTSKVATPGFFARVFSFLTGRKSPGGRPAVDTPKPVATTTAASSPVPPPAPVLGVEQLVTILEADLTISESDLTRLALDRAQAVERNLQEAGVDGARMSVTAPAAGQSRVELQLR